MNRREFSDATKREAWARCNGLCEGCGQPFSVSSPPEYDHDLDDWMGGDNSLGNCKVLGKKCCHMAKSAAAATPRAKADRLRDARAGIRKRSAWRGNRANVRQINEEPT